MAPLGYERAILGPVFRDYNVESSMLEVSGRMTTVLVRKLRDTEAAEIAEAAMVLPVVFLFLLGVIWFGRAFNIYATIQQAAQQGAVTGARPYSASVSASSFPPDSDVAKTVSAVMKASSIDPSQIINPGTPMGCTAPSKIVVCRQVLLNTSSNPTQMVSCPEPTPSQICGTLITFQYPFQFYLPYTSLNLSKIILTAKAQSRTEN
jgi:hypothetical protein